MEPIQEIKKQPFSDEEKKPYGRSIKPAIKICSRKLERPLYPLIVLLCYFCQKNSSEQEFFETNAGRWCLNIQMCPRCTEYNMALPKAGNIVLKKYIAQEREEQIAKVSNYQVYKY